MQASHLVAAIGAMPPSRQPEGPGLRAFTGSWVRVARPDPERALPLICDLTCLEARLAAGWVAAWQGAGPTSAPPFERWCSKAARVGATLLCLHSAASPADAGTAPGPWEIHQSYQRVLARELQALSADFGGVLHVKVNPRPAIETCRGARSVHAAEVDFVLDGDGQHPCHPAFADVVARGLRSFGYSVASMPRPAGWRAADPLDSMHGRQCLQLDVHHWLCARELWGGGGEHAWLLHWQLDHVLRDLAQCVQFRLSQADQLPSCR